MTLFLTWQSAELNSRPLTRRQSPPEGNIHTQNGKRTLLERELGTRIFLNTPVVTLALYLNGAIVFSLESTGLWFSWTRFHAFPVLFLLILYLHRCSTISTLRFLLNINNAAFAWSSFSKRSVRWSKAVSTHFYLILWTSQSKGIDVISTLCCWNWSVVPWDTVEFLFLSFG